MQQPHDPSKPTILMMSDCPLLHTGQAVVVREVATGLSKLGKYNVVVAAWGYNGYPHNLPFTMLPASARDFGKSGHPDAGVPGIEQIINHVKPNFLWTIGDIWMVDYISALGNRKNFKWIAYTPIDGEPIPDYWRPWLNNPDRLVMETEYGYNEVRKFDSKVDHRWIYHGCNPRVYYPLPDEVRKNIKKSIHYLKITGPNNVNETIGLPDDTFIVGTVARNQPRKNYDRNLKAFKIFAKDKPNVRLWIHASPVDQGYNLVQLADHLKISDKVIFTPKNSIVNGLNEDEMNMLMNMFDVHFLPTQGEGFGIPILETMAAGVPQVVPDYTSHVEFARKGGLLIPLDPEDDFITGLPHTVERAIPKPSECAKLLNQLYSDNELRLRLGKSARETAEKMTWEATIPKWDAVLQEMLVPQNTITSQSEIKIETFKI